MKTQKISISFSRYTDANFETLALHIVASLTSNPAFSDPTPKLTVVTAALTAYSSALVAAKTLDKKSMAEKNSASTALEQLLAELGRYVMFVANGNAKTLISSRYPLSKMPEQHLQNPCNVNLSNGISTGQLVAAVKRPKGAKGYLHEICAEAPGENTVWTSTATSRSRYTFTNLQPGKQYWVRVAATGSNQQIAYSPVASQYAQ